MSSDDGHILGSLNASLAQKMAEKYSPELETNIRSWLATELNNPQFADSSLELQPQLKDGIQLCTYVSICSFFIHDKTFSQNVNFFISC